MIRMKDKHTPFPIHMKVLQQQVWTLVQPSTNKKPEWVFRTCTDCWCRNTTTDKWYFQILMLSNLKNNCSNNRKLKINVEIEFELFILPLCTFNKENSPLTKTYYLCCRCYESLVWCKISQFYCLLWISQKKEWPKPQPQPQVYRYIVFGDF